MFKVNNKNTRTTSMFLLLTYLWTYYRPFSSVSIVEFEQVNVSWDGADFIFQFNIISAPLQTSCNFFTFYNIWHTFLLSLCDISLALTWCIDKPKKKKKEKEKEKKTPYLYTFSLKIPNLIETLFNVSPKCFGIIAFCVTFAALKAIYWMNNLCWVCRFFVIFGFTPILIFRGIWGNISRIFRYCRPRLATWSGKYFLSICSSTRLKIPLRPS